MMFFLGCKRCIELDRKNLLTLRMKNWIIVGTLNFLTLQDVLKKSSKIMDKLLHPRGVLWKKMHVLINEKALKPSEKIMKKDYILLINCHKNHQRKTLNWSIRNPLNLVRILKRKTKRFYHNYQVYQYCTSKHSSLYLEG